MEIAKITNDQALATIRGITSAVANDSWRDDIPCLIGGILQIASYGLQFIHKHDGPLVFGSFDEHAEILHALENFATVLDPELEIEVDSFSGPLADRLFKLALAKLIEMLRNSGIVTPEIQALIDLIAALFGL